MISQLRRNSLYLLLARLTAQGLAILFIALLARRLDIESFGQFTFIAAIVLIGNTVTNFGTDTYLIRELARAGKPTDLIGQILSLQLVLSAFWVITTLVLKPNSPLLLYSLSLFPLAIFSVASAALRAFERMDLVWSLSLGNGLIQVVAAILSTDLLTLCLFLLIGQFLIAALAYWIWSVSHPSFGLIPQKDFIPLFKLTLPFAALTILLVLSQRLGVLTVSALLGDSPTGIFSSVTRVVDGLKLGHYAILGALLPVISRGTAESKQSFRKGFIVLAGSSFLMATVLVLFPRLIILILYGESFVSAVPLLALLGWSLIPYTVSSFISYDLIAQGREKTLVKATAISLMMFLALFIGLIPVYHLNGAIYAALMGEIMQAIVFVVYHRRCGSRRRAAPTANN